MPQPLAQSVSGQPQSPTPAAAAVANSILGWTPDLTSPPAWVPGLDGSRGLSRSHSQRYQRPQLSSLRPSNGDRTSQRHGSAPQRSQQELASAKQRRHHQHQQHQQHQEDGLSDGRLAVPARASAQLSMHARELHTEHGAADAAAASLAGRSMLLPPPGRGRASKSHSPAPAINAAPPNE